MMYPVKFLTRDEAEEILKKIKVYPRVVEYFSNKLDLIPIYISSLTFVQANIIKQEAISVDIDAAIPHGMIDATTKRGDILLIGDRHRLRKLVPKLKCQPYGLKKIGKEIEKIVETFPAKSFKIRKREKIFDCRGPVIMGILNVTPDSFSDGGRYSSVEKAIAKAEKMIEEGADIIDVGGESTRPGAEPVTIKEEIKRVVPVIKEIRKRWEIPISIDTSKPEVAKITVEEGADIINEITAAKDPEMENFIIENKIPIVLMHMLGEPRTMQKNPEYKDLIGEIYQFLEERVNFFLRNGMEKETIAIDPGIGFGKTVEHNLMILNHLDSFLYIGTPLLIGPSRKSFIGITLNLPVEERVEGTIASVVWSYMKGACIFRVHDIKENLRALKLASAIKNSFSHGELKN